MSPRALFFDFGGTLDADGVSWKERFHALWRAEGVRVEAEAFYPLYYAADDPLVEQDARDLAYADVVRALSRELGRALGLTGEAAADRVADAFVAESRAQVARNRPVLERLAERHRLGVISNFYGNLESALDEVGLLDLFPVALDSVRVGASKPDPAIFHRALAEIGAEARDAVMVGDSLPRDMEGAKAVGMPHVWLVPASRAGARPCCVTDRVIHRLVDLPGALP
jgi:putative hydrolase of the HAD superfamily